MPLIVEGGRIPPRWASEGPCRKGGPNCGTSTEHLNIALINNMPDAALEDTELQFFDLIDEASGDVLVYLKLYSLAGIPRTDRGQRHLNSFYYSLDELWQNQFDGVIITGTEPRQPDLRDEPYWSALAEVFDWAERNTASAILSCLAAHASVLHSDGIQRHRLPDKQCGVFDFALSAAHPLTANASQRIKFPHSRWNEVQADALLACGYKVLTQSFDGGVDTFIKKKRQSLFVHFQGHPEYGAETLLKEYRRDIRRFLKQERETYPVMPKSYFAAAGERVASSFQEAVMATSLTARCEELMDGFPGAALAATLQKTWQPHATTLYRNWLRFVVSAKMERSKVSTVSPIRDEVEQKRTALQ
jgi:homoserine O-succinyltransferase